LEGKKVGRTEVRSQDIRKREVVYLPRRLKNVQFCFRPRQAKILTTDIHRVFRGLKFEPNAGIGQKGTFFKGLFSPFEIHRVSF
jgi:hypothetical protein